MCVGEQRCGLGHSIAHSVAEPDLVETLLHLRIQGRSTHNVFLHIATECSVQGRAHFLEDNLPQTRDMAQNLHRRLAESRFDGRLVDFFHHERNCQNQIRLDSLHGLQQQGWSRRLAQEIDAGASAQRVEELEHQTVDVGHRKH